MTISPNSSVVLVEYYSREAASTSSRLVQYCWREDESRKEKRDRRSREEGEVRRGKGLKKGLRNMSSII